MIGARAPRGMWLAVGIAVALLAAWVPPAGARERLDSFSGSCSVQGTVHFSPPATNTQQMLDVSYGATGMCSGTLNGRSLSNAPVRLFHAVDGVDGSCLRADTTQPGHGTITFGDGSTIPYSFEFHFVLTEGNFMLQGQRSGSAHGSGSFATQRTPPGLPLQCGGDGVSDAPMDMSLTTDSPLVSKHTGGGRGATRVPHR